MNFKAWVVLVPFVLASTLARAEGLQIRDGYRGGSRPEVVGFYNYDPAYPGEFRFEYRLPVENSFIKKTDEVEIVSLIDSKETLESDDLKRLAALVRPYKLRLQVVRRNKVLAICKESLLLGFRSSLKGGSEQVVIQPDLSWVGIENGKVSANDRGVCRDTVGRKIVPRIQSGDILRLVRGKNAKEVARGIFKPI